LQQLRYLPAVNQKVEERAREERERERERKRKRERERELGAEQRQPPHRHKNNAMSEQKRRRIIVEDDDEEEEDLGSVGSNPDERLGDDRIPTDDEEGEDLQENWLADYAPAPQLDYYDETVLARDEDIEVESYEKRMRDRLAAEEELDAMDFKRREAVLHSEQNLERISRYEQEELDVEDDEEEGGAENADKALNLEAFDCPLREWIADERTRREIHRRFKKFLLSYYVGIEEVTRWIKRHEHMNPTPPLPPPLRVTPPIYPAKISTMCANNSASLEISYGHLGEMQSLLAIWLTDVPRDMLKIFDEVLQSVVLDSFPHYAMVSGVCCCCQCCCNALFWAGIVPFSNMSFHFAASYLFTYTPILLYSTLFPSLRRSAPRRTSASSTCPSRTAYATCARAISTTSSASRASSPSARASFPRPRRWRTTARAAARCRGPTTCLRVPPRRRGPLLAAPAAALPFR
jgi:hypothetical protein